MTRDSCNERYTKSLWRVMVAVCKTLLLDQEGRLCQGAVAGSICYGTLFFPLLISKARLPALGEKLKRLETIRRLKWTALAGIPRPC
jgi:hypothetical protein